MQVPCEHSYKRPANCDWPPDLDLACKLDFLAHGLFMEPVRVCVRARVCARACTQALKCTCMLTKPQQGNCTLSLVDSGPIPTRTPHTQGRRQHNQCHPVSGLGDIKFTIHVPCRFGACSNPESARPKNLHILFHGRQVPALQTMTVPGRHT